MDIFYNYIINDEFTPAYMSTKLHVSLHIGPLTLEFELSDGLIRRKGRQ